MHFSARTLDDLLRKLLPRLLSSRGHVSPTRGDTRELVGVLLEVRLPRARLSRTEIRGKPFSCLGEFLWYLSQGNKLDFIRHYIPAYAEESEDGETIYGGYGPRLFDQRGNNQLQNVIDLLTSNPGSRRAVIQLFNAEDIARRHARHKEVPCTCTLQFLIRRGQLHLLTTMRSNDAYTGLPHDVFCFTMLQEVMARTLGLKLGKYRHFVGSLHLYEKNWVAAQQYLNEAVQSTVLMPEMPKGDPWPSLRKLLDAEYRIRNGAEIDASAWDVDPYWGDLIRLLQIYAATGNTDRIESLQGKMVFDRYGPYIENRKSMTRRPPPPQRQLLLPL